MMMKAALSMKYKIFLFIRIFAVFMVAATSAVTSTHAQSLKIGLSLPLSGAAAPLGRQFVAGARFAMRELPALAQVKLIVSDDGCDSELSKLATGDLKAAGVKLITGYLCNEAVYSAATLLSDANIPMLIAGARSNRILKDRKRHAWNVWQFAPRDEDVAKAAFDALINRWRSKPFAIADDGTIFGRTQAEDFRALMEDAGVKPQFVDNFRPTQSTQAGLIRRLTKAGVEAVFIGASGEDVALIARNMIEFGTSNIEIATGDAISLLPYLEDDHEIPVGLYSLMPTPPEQIEAIIAMKDRLKASNLEPEPYLLLGYASMQIVADFLENNSGDLTGQQYSTILGPVQFDDQGRNTISQYHLHRWNGTKFSRVF